MQDIYDCTVKYILENQDKFYRLAYSYVQNQESALDVVQNAICRGLENYQTLKNPDALKTWFYRILVNEALQYLRKQKKESFVSIDEEYSLIYTEPALDKDYETYEAVMQLPEAQRTVIILRYYEDLTLQQIAEITDANLNTVKTRLYTALEKLGKKLKKEGDV